MGETALIAAFSQGLGFAIADRLIREGANVVISGREEEKLKQKVNRTGGKLGLGKHPINKADITNTQ